MKKFAKRVGKHLKSFRKIEKRRERWLAARRAGLVLSVAVLTLGAAALAWRLAPLVYLAAGVAASVGAARYLQDRNQRLRLAALEKELALEESRRRGFAEAERLIRLDSVATLRL